MKFLEDDFVDSASDNIVKQKAYNYNKNKA